MFVDGNGVHPYGSFWLDVADKAIKAGAVIVAAFWTYYNQAKSRTYKPRPGFSVTGEIFSKNDDYYVLVACRVKNDGHSDLTITQIGTFLEAETMSPNGRKPLAGAEIFTAHSWIEPGEQIDEPIILAIPNPQTFVALRLNLRVVSEGIEWNASCMLRAPLQDGEGDPDEIS